VWLDDFRGGSGKLLGNTVRVQHRFSDVFADWVGKALIVTCVWNLNGVFTMALNVGTAFSTFLLVGSLYMLVRFHRFSWSPPFLIFILMVVSYLSFGYYFYSDAYSVRDSSNYIRAYISSILLVWAVTGYIVWTGLNNNLIPLMHFLRNCFVIAAVAVWFSPIIYQFYVNLPPSSEQRMGGFFANPNEAGITSLLAMLIVVGLPFKNRLLQLGALCLTFGAAILTFSKMAMSLAILILAWQLVRWLRRISLVIIPIVAFASILIVQDVSSVFNTIAEQPILELGKSQKARVMAIGSILSAKIDRDTSTGRTELWAIGIKKAWERFPLGWGLGSFHHLIGGHYERGLWLGVHNTYLMLWGEGGALVGILVLLWIFTMILYASRSVLRSVALPWALIFLVSMMTGHSVLGHRYQNLALAVVFGLIALTASARELQQRRLAAAAISAQAGFAPAGRRFVTLETRA
jgi:hypothetical protein